jgi:hypothetical protein
MNTTGRRLIPGLVLALYILAGMQASLHTHAYGGMTIHACAVCTLGHCTPAAVHVVATLVPPGDCAFRPEEILPTASLATWVARRSRAPPEV